MTIDNFNEMTIDDLNYAVEQLVDECHQNAVAHGFWAGEDRNDGELIALMHSELSEMLEGIRHGNPPSEHIPDFSAAEEEAADLFIRLADLCGGRGWRLGQAIIAKMRFNASRPYKHGKAF